MALPVSTFRRIFTPIVMLIGLALQPTNPFTNSPLHLFALNAAASPSPAPDKQVPAGVLENLSKLPLSFEANQGQAEARVKFLSRSANNQLLLATNEAVWFLSRHDNGRQNHRQPVKTSATLRMRLSGAARLPEMEGIDQLPGRSNYFVGNDPKQWRTNVAQYGRVKYRDVYPGIDLIFYGNQQHYEFDFVVAAGADPRKIKLSFAGMRRMRIDKAGNLVFDTAAGEVKLQQPAIWQELNGHRRKVAGRYIIGKKREVRFELGNYDRQSPLTIDPVLVYSTFLGGGGYDTGNGIAVDSAGNVYVVGSTSSSPFPTTPGAISRGSICQACNKVFISKIAPSGNMLVYSATLGGSYEDVGEGVAIDAAGNAYVTGVAASNNFPTTAGAYQPRQAGNNGATDAFVAKLNAQGNALVFSTYLGGANGDSGRGIALDAANNVYVAGITNSTDFPVSLPGIQKDFGGVSGLNFGDAFVARLEASGRTLDWSTYLGGSETDSAWGVAADAQGNAYVCGVTQSANFPTTPGSFRPVSESVGIGSSEAFVAKVNADGNSLGYSTYLGGITTDWAHAIAVDSAGNAYVTGFTNSADFPTTPGAFQTKINHDPYENSGAQDAFVTKLNDAGKALVYSTFLGGIYEEYGYGIVVDTAGSAYVTGSSQGYTFPITPGSFQPRSNGHDVFVSRLDAAGSLLIWSALLGGTTTDNGFAIAIDGNGNAYVTGDTTGNDFPVINPGQTFVGGGTDAIVARISDVPTNGTDLVVFAKHDGLFSVATNGVYKVMVRNAGSVASSGAITLTDELPAGLGFVSGTGAGWRCSATGQMVSCQRDLPLSPGEITTVDLTVSVGSAAIPRVKNIVTISHPSDGNSANNTHEDLTVVIPVCNIRLAANSETMIAGSGVRRLEVFAPAGCLWTAKSNTDWIKLFAVNSGSILYEVSPYTGTVSRVGIMTVAGQTYTLTQLGQTTSVSGASYTSGSPGPGAIAAMFGVGLATTTQAATSLPLPTSLAGTTIKLIAPNGNEHLAKLFFVSSTQINYLVPKELSYRNNTVLITSGDGTQRGELLDFGTSAPGIFSANANGAGIAAAVALQINADGSQAYLPVAKYDMATGKYVSVPIEVNSDSAQYYLVLFGTGISAYLNSSSTAEVKIGGVVAPVIYIGSQGGYEGLDQVNVALPRSLRGRGEIDLSLVLNGLSTNFVTINVK